MKVLTRAGGLGLSWFLHLKLQGEKVDLLIFWRYVWT